MAPIALADARVKDLLKQAILELFQERTDLFIDLVVEGLEAWALSNAIKEGKAVSRAEIVRR